MRNLASRHARLRAGDRLRVRRATVGDLDILVHHRRGMWEHLNVRNRNSLDQADQVYRRWVRSKLRNGKVVAWVVESSSGTIVGGGCLWLRPTQPRPNLTKPVDPYLLSMYTEPDFRRRGVASLIVIEAIKWSRKNGYGSIFLHASKNGRRLYREYGFSRSWEMRRQPG